jgi:uncharacterized membrane protein
MAERPKVNLPLTPTDRIVELSGWIALFVLWIGIWWYYPSLPDNIPAHFDVNGQVNRYDHKNTIFLLPAIGSIIVVGLTVLNRFPHLFNYPTTITAENALVQYTYATRLIRYLKTTILFVFLFLTYTTIQIAAGETNQLAPWFLPITLIAVFIPVVFFIIQSYKRK